MAGLVGADVLVGRVLERAAHVTDRGVDHAGHILEVLLRTPEASGGEGGLGDFGACVLRRLPCPWAQTSSRRNSGSSAGRWARGPSSKTWPRWASQRAQRISVRSMPKLLSSPGDDIFRRDRLEETGPAGAGIEFRVGGEEGQVAADAVVDAVLVVVVKGAAKGRLGAFAARDLVLVGGELLAPLGVRLHDLGHFDGIGQFAARSHEPDFHQARLGWRDCGLPLPVNIRATNAPPPKTNAPWPRVKRNFLRFKGG